MDIKSGARLTINYDIVAGTGTVYLTERCGNHGRWSEDHGCDMEMNAAGTIAVNAATEDVTTLAATLDRDDHLSGCGRPDSG